VCSSDLPIFSAQPDGPIFGAGMFFENFALIVAFSIGGTQPWFTVSRILFYYTAFDRINRGLNHCRVVHTESSIRRCVTH